MGALRQLARSRPDEEDEEEESGPDAPTEILRRRARQAIVDATAANVTMDEDEELRCLARITWSEGANYETLRVSAHTCLVVR